MPLPFHAIGSPQENVVFSFCANSFSTSAGQKMKYMI
jgi:hypothetical protein